MQATMLRTLIEVEPASSQQPQPQPQQQQLPAAPARAISRTYPAVPQPQQGDEDEGIMLRSVRHPPRDDNAAPTPMAMPSGSPSVHSTPGGDEMDLEMMAGPRPGSPVIEPADAFEVLPSLFDPPMNKYRLAACCLMNLLGGLTDSAPGALIPYMEAHYNIGYAVVSLIFVGNALGFVTAAPLVEALRRTRLGRAGSLAVSQLCVALGFAPLVLEAPFPAVCAAYFLLGFGEALALALNNVFCANLRDGTAMLGAMHGSYGLGGTIGPLVATALVATTGDSGSGSGSGSGSAWGRYYFLTLGLALCSAAFGYWSFRDYERESAPAPAPAPASASGPDSRQNDDDLLRHNVDASSAEHQSTTEEEQDGMQQQQQQQTKQLPTLLAALRSRVVVLGALFIFAYQGAEVSISGWVISFLIAARGGDPARVGYVTAGFWAGITLGRFALSPLGARGGAREKPFVYALIAGAAIFELLVWWVPNVAGEAVSLAVVGLLLGPVYPCSAAVFVRNLLPRDGGSGGGSQVHGLGIISAFGSAGGAVAPFTTGLLAQAAGTFVLHPIAIGLFAVMALTWWGQPNARKRTE
ncbi:hypothetical protein SLS62_002480 [Diatrype stigma]|uniref:Major facilitator superfamily (MFS) profile domain-containing protein n=1 Tax=Diatrype stigma TaxID=117547 RepID=A0AAN9UXB3_9PEZI